MQLYKILVSSALTFAACLAQDSGLLGGIVTPDRVVAPLNQVLTGAWAALARRAAPPGTPIPPPAPILFVFHADGTMTGTATGADSSFSGVWIQVADRKFLVTYFVFNYNEARTVASIAKVRLTTRVDSDGRMSQGNQEVLVIDPDGKLMFTAVGGTHSMVRLSPEKPADFDAFLALQ